MLQYLLNTTAIWLSSLLLFDVFLRRESYHSYNRFYLLFTFLLGILLPMWGWQENSAVTHAMLGYPVERLITAKGSIVTAGTPATGISLQNRLPLLYLAGMIVALCLFMTEIARLAKFYRSGTRSVQDGWTVIETNKDNAPFSFLNTLFINSKAQYSIEEWGMLLDHERRHSALFHLGDLLLMQLSHIIFWFHPLVYMYSKRLLLVHEYQADHASARQPQAYGKFLIEQAVLQSAPRLTHSFNRSPIKKRIIMLTRRSSALAKSKMFIFIPLAMVCIICFSKNSFSKRNERNGNIVQYRGNTFEYSAKQRFDTVLLTDPVTGQQSGKVVKHDPIPEKMNGNRIYLPSELSSQPQSYAQNGSIPDYLFKNLSKYLDKLPDGTYRLDINNIVIDPNGKIVYFEGIGLCRTTDTRALGMKELIAQKTDDILNNAPALKPGKANGHSVPVLSDIIFMAYEIEVKDHQTSVTQIWK
jgi:bla regulator protein blaR1